MQYHEIVNILAPCGLSCAKCFAFTRGEIASHSKQLQRLLGNFDIYAQRFSAFLPAFNDYPSFRQLLSYLAEPDCRGCRQGTCKYPDCGVVDCYQAKGVDFCFQCADFPCHKTNFDPHLEARWRRMNMRIKAIGVEAYYEETKDDCRYI